MDTASNNNLPTASASRAYRLALTILILLNLAKALLIIGGGQPFPESDGVNYWKMGIDVANDHARDAWDFLRGYVSDAHQFIFSRAGFAWDGLPRDRISVIRPSIDAFAPKNAEQSREQSLAIMATAGNQTITATDSATAAIAGTTNAISVSPGAATHFAVGVTPNQVQLETVQFGVAFYFLMAELKAKDVVP